MTPKQAYLNCWVHLTRSPELEFIILTHPGYSYCYARDIIQGRWPEAEHIIKQDDYYWEYYCSHFKIKEEKCNWKVGL